MKKNIPIFTGKLAKFLMKKGFKLVDIAPNKKYPRETVFYFEQTNEIWEAIKEFQAQEKGANTDEKGDNPKD